jgi:hypothetical protein
MTFTCININTTYYLELFITDVSGNPKAGLNPTYTIYKSTDDSIIAGGNLIDIGNGLYKNSYIFLVTGQYYIIYTTPEDYSDEIESIIVQNEIAKESTLLRVLGLSDENKKILNTVHDSDGNLTNATVKIYPTLVDFDNDTNVSAIYEYDATYNSNGLMQTMGVKRTL